MRLRIERTEHGLCITNEGDQAVSVSPAEMPDEIRDRWHRLEPTCSYECIVSGDVIAQDVVS